MKKVFKTFTAFLCSAILVMPLMAGCSLGKKPDTPVTPDKPTPPSPEDFIDYASQLKLDMNSETKKQEVTVKFYIDGDTTHFQPTSNASDFVNNYIKARYLAVNTPESTGDVEKWGKTASNYTHSRLEGAEKIIVESDDDKWNVDSTNERYLLWIWYIPDGEPVADENFRNLNVELLQEGYGRGSKTSDNRYGETAFAALMQAQTYKLKLYSTEKDPNWFGDGTIPQLTLKYFRYHMHDVDEEGNSIYAQHPVSISGYITARYENSVYIEQYDEETGVSYGIPVFYGYKLGTILEILSVGNYVNVVGTLGLFYGSWQISGVEYNDVRPNSPKNTQLIDEELGKETIPTNPFRTVSISEFTAGAANKLTTVFTTENDEGEVIDEDERSLEYGEAVLDTSVSLVNCEVVPGYGTYQSKNGEMSLVVKDASGQTITLRTLAWTKEDGTAFSLKDFQNADGSYKKIKSVKGIVDYYTPEGEDVGNYQIAVWDFSCFEFDE